MASSKISNPSSRSMDFSNSNEAKHIFILSGQSNMVGQGGVDEHNHWDNFVPSECAADSTKVFRLNAHLSWEVAREPLHRDIDTKGGTSGVGPGMSFANAVKDSMGVIGLVPCAVNGTAIEEWARGGQLYENMVKRAKAALRCGGGIKSLLWYQGESDTASQHRVDCYKENMEGLIHNLRNDLGLPSLPVIQVAIASGNLKYLEKIREIQKGINIPNVVCVDAMGLQLKEDILHLTTGPGSIGPFSSPSLSHPFSGPRIKSLSSRDREEEAPIGNPSSTMLRPNKDCGIISLLYAQRIYW